MKKKPRILLKLTYIAFGSLLLSLNYSCQNDNETVLQAKTDQHLITQDEAILIAENLNLNEGTSSKFSKGSKIKKASYAFPFFTKKKEAAFYAINYENGGFAIVSADDRNTPVLAFSENSSFQNDTINYPEGLKMWLAFQTKNIENIKIKNEVQSALKKSEWSFAAKKTPKGSPTSKIEPEDPATCPPDQNEVVGPLLKTTWGQGQGYNTYVSLLCSNKSGGRAPTGCVATAMAQIMKYYQKPSSYNWANMPVDYGTTTTAALMSDIGAAVNMDYNCDGSSANSKEQIASSFINDFHYSNASGGNYNYQTVVSQIAAGKPVILTGGRKKSGISFNMYTDGHAWVCDGYRKSTLYYYDDSQGFCQGTGYLQLYMNWGWSGLYNGWFSFNNFNPTPDNTYNYEPRMYYNITP